MFDEVLCHLFTLSTHSVLSVLDFYVSHLRLNTSGGPSRRYKVGANEANALAPGRSGNGTTRAVYIYTYQEITASKWLSPAVSTYVIQFGVNLGCIFTSNPDSLFVSRTGFHNMSKYREHIGQSLGLEID